MVVLYISGACTCKKIVTNYKSVRKCLNIILTFDNRTNNYLNNWKPNFLRYFPLYEAVEITMTVILR